MSAPDYTGFHHIRQDEKKRKKEKDRLSIQQISHTIMSQVWNTQLFHFISNRSFNLNIQTTIYSHDPSELGPAASSHSGDLLVLGSLLDGGLLADDLLQSLQAGVLGAQVAHARLAALE